MPLLPLLLVVGAVVWARRSREERSLAAAAPSASPVPPPNLPVLGNGKPTPVPAAKTGLSAFLADMKGRRFRDILTGGINVQDESELKSLERQIDSHLVLTSGLFVLSVAARFGAPWLNLISLPGFAYLAAPFVSEAYRQVVKERRVGLAVVDAIFTVGMISKGYFIVLSLFGALYLASRKMLLKTRNRSREELIDIFQNRVLSVFVDINGSEVEIPFQQLQAGHVVVVNAGETIPADGAIVKGIATVDERMLTGESQPADKSEGDKVFASTVAISGRIWVRVDKTGADTLAGQITQILQQTADKKSSVELKAEVLAEKSALPMLALGAFTWSTMGAGHAFAVLTCTPGYSLKVTGPVSVLNFLKLTADGGILVKDGRAFERLSKIDTIVFDKTGTLTEDRFQVSAVYPCADVSPDALMLYAATAEQKQTHPIALAILAEARFRLLELPPIDDANYSVGYGIKTVVLGKTVRVGSRRFMDFEKITIPAGIQAIQNQCGEAGHSLVYAALEDALIGVIELQPVLRQEAAQLVAQLSRRKITTYIISGDHEQATRHLAEYLDVDHYYSEKLPEEKAALVEQLRREGRSVCFIGDGINDSIALNKADVSISLTGASGLAQDSAQIVLLDGSLRQLLHLLDLAHEQQASLRNSLVISVLPASLGIVSVFAFHASVATTSLLSYLGLLTGIGNAMLPRWKRPNSKIPPNIPTAPLQLIKNKGRLDRLDSGLANNDPSC